MDPAGPSSTGAEGWQIFGLAVDSFLPLPELRHSSAAPEIQIRRGTISSPPPESAQPEPWTRVGDDEILLRWRELGTFLVRNGREIIVDPVPGAEPAALRLFLLGPVLALLLHQRGLLLLHASAIARRGGAVAFAGRSGAGKSTLAAALHARGHRFVSDDIVAIDASTAPVTVRPAFPQVKLWPESAAALGSVVSELPKLRPEIDKRALRVGRGFRATPLPLRRLYVLDRGNSPSIEPLSRAETLIELLRHSYAPRLLHATAGRARFVALGKLAAELPAARLRCPPALTELPAIAELVEADCDPPQAPGPRV